METHLSQDDSKLLKGTKRRRVNVTTACANCQRFHTSCGMERPCRKCVEKGKECTEGIAKKRGRKKGVKAAPALDAFTLGDIPNLKLDEILDSWSGSEDSPDALGSPVTSPHDEWKPLDFDLFLQELDDNKLTYRGVQEQHETPSTFSRLEFTQFKLDHARARLPHAFPRTETVELEARKQMAKIREAISKEMADEMWSQFDSHVERFSRLFEDLGTPAIIWEHCGIVHYANEAYRNLTGFYGTTPTFISDLCMYRQLDDRGLEQVLLMGEEFLRSKGKDRQTIACGLRVGEKGEYMDGTMCITLKRDSLGLPLLFCANFLPRL